MATVGQQLASLQGQLHHIERKLDALIDATTGVISGENAMANAQHARIERDAKRAAGKACSDCGDTGWVDTYNEVDNCPVTACHCPEGARFR
jgi:hypothetical protein